MAQSHWRELSKGEAPSGERFELRALGVGTGVEAITGRGDGGLD